MQIEPTWWISVIEIPIAAALFWMINGLRQDLQARIERAGGDERTGLEAELIGWLTTVNPDGQPQSSPISNMSSSVICRSTRRSSPRLHRRRATC